MTQFVQVEKQTGKVVAFFEQAAAPTPVEGYDFYALATPLAQIPPQPPRRPTQVLYWANGALEWRETATLTQHGNSAIAYIDAQCDVAREMIAGSGGRLVEYQRAEKYAREYQVAGYPAGYNVHRNVQDWADAARQTAQWAAESIIAQADRWYTALDDFRNLRLKAKEDVRRIMADPLGTHAQLDAREDQFGLDFNSIMEGLQ